MIQAINHLVVIRPAKTDNVTDSGIVLPGRDFERKTSQGTVLSVGPGYREDSGAWVSTEDINEGDTVLFERFAGSEISYDGEDLFIMPVQNILAVLSS